jgi:UDP-2,3-diacylglucosamine hydrolase
MSSLFVSDLHLSDKRRDKVDLFIKVLARVQEQKITLYILGDLFDIWLGDDDEAYPNKEIVQAIGNASRNGACIHVAMGNRDFLFREGFKKKTGALILDDYTVIELNSEKVLLTHGDLLCTRDVKYQKFRRFVRAPLVSSIFLALPLKWRKIIGGKTQEKTQNSIRTKTDSIMDVDLKTVISVMSQHNVSLLIHGHTHRPGIHEFKINNDPVRRIVLGDWYEQELMLFSYKGKTISLTAQAFLA